MQTELRETAASILFGLCAHSFQQRYYLGPFGSAPLTEIIGIHALFGAFLLGAIIPQQSALA